MREKMFVVTALLVGVTTLTCLAPIASTRAAAQIKEAAPAPGEFDESSILCRAGECRGTNEKLLAQRKPDPVKFPVPRTRWDGKPDFNGVFYPQVTIARAPMAMDALARPELRGMREKLHPEADDPAQHCTPVMTQGGMTSPHPIQLLHAPGVIVMINEYLNHYRIIPTDGRPHDPSAAPSIQGDSVGHWEGDTLVVDITKFNGKGWLSDYFEDARLPLPASDAMHVVERWTRPDAETIEWEAVYEDPTRLVAPYKSPKRRRARLPFDMVQESTCLEEFAGTWARESDTDLEQKGLKQ